MELINYGKGVRTSGVYGQNSETCFVLGSHATLGGNQNSLAHFDEVSS